jgi:hypothetical protein
MRTQILIAATIAIASCACAQGQLNPVGQGNILHPGIPMSGPPRPRANAAGAQRGPVYVPYGPIDPFYYGYTGGYGYGAPYYPAPNDPNAAGYYGPQPPTVIINQNFQPDTLHPILNDYTNVPLPPPGAVQTPPPPAPGAPTIQRLDQDTAQGPAAQSPVRPLPLRDDQPTIFLIAMKDHTIYPVIAYWVDKDTLNYVTVESVLKHVPLDQVDRDLSRQLNDQRNVEFKLPTR